jgi:hypothetical protein
MSYNDEYVKATSSGSCPVADLVITGVEISATVATVSVIAI